VNQYHENKNQNISQEDQPKVSQSELFARWDNPALIEVLARDIRSFEFSNQISVESFISFLKNPDVVEQFELMDIDELSIRGISDFAKKVDAQNREKPLLTVFNTICHSKSTKKPIAIAIFNKYIALTHKQHEQNQGVRESNVNSQQENKALALEQIQILKRKYAQTPQDEMPIYGAGGVPTNIESMKTRPRFDIGVLDEGE
jgi:hypothetical protein